MSWSWLFNAPGRFLPGILITLIYLAGCSTASFKPPSSDALHAWQVRKPELVQVQGWQFSGRVVIKTEDESWNGIIIWDQQPDAYLIDFKTPLGQSVLQLTGDEKEAVLRLSDQKELRAADGESLIHSQLGWSLPIHTLVSWVKGVPASDVEHEFLLDDSGRMLKLKQSDWDIDFKRYTRVKELELPNKLFMENEALNIRLVIDKWVL